MGRSELADPAIGGADPLRFVTYLAPGLPLAFFQGVAAYVGATLGCRTTLTVDASHSGPPRDGSDPFSGNRVDVGFMCAPPYGWLRERSPSPVELLGPVPVFSDPRSGGAPTYFSEVVVRADHPARSFAQLMARRALWAYNDPCSLSGYYALLERFADEGATEPPPLRCSGSHRASIDMVLGGQVEAASIDANVLALVMRSAPDLTERLRMVECLGPYPVQPVVVRAGMDSETKAKIVTCLLSMARSPAGRRCLSRAGVTRFVAAPELSYHVTASITARCERAFGASPMEADGG
ncbi:MAG: phosphate/phosphite/phosphonate ABC transporter substrate-binding protein [Actinomycetota bacterium]